MGAGLTFISVWANTGNRINPGAGKIALGWGPGEQPANEYENERQYTRDTLLNAITTYLNNGVPLSDLLAGSVSLASNSEIEFIGSDTTKINADGLSVWDDDNTCNVEAEGLQHIVEEGSSVRNQHPLAVNLSGTSWSSLGDSNYVLSETIDIPNLSYNENVSGIYSNGCLIGVSGGQIFSIAAKQYRIENSAAGAYLKLIVVNSSVDPSTLTNPRFFFNVANASTLIPSGA